MIQVFKIANNYYDPLTTNSIFDFNKNSRLRGHNLKISKQRVNKTKFASFFSNRVVNSWNKLPNFIVNSKSINEFKNKFDDYNKNIMYKINLDVYWLQISLLSYVISSISAFFLYVIDDKLLTILTCIAIIVNIKKLYTSNIY